MTSYLILKHLYTNSNNTFNLPMLLGNFKRRRFRCSQMTITATLSTASSKLTPTPIAIETLTCVLSASDFL